MLCLNGHRYLYSLGVGRGGGGGGIGLKSLCLNSYPYLIGFYSSFYRHALIQNFLGANFTVHVYIYVTFRESEERFICRPTCRLCRYNSNSYLYMVNYNLFETPSLFR